jgi:hypothetical protein
VLLPGVSGFGAKLTVVPAGLPAEVRLIGVENPPCAAVPKVIAADGAPAQVILAAAGLSKVNPVGGVSIVKLVLQMSKKILPTDSTLIRAVVVGELGIITSSVPSFAVLATNVTGKVNPPSVDKRIFTFEQLTGALVVFATVQVTV